VLREDLLERIPRGVPTMLDYRTHAQHRSRYNTPPVFAIYVLMLVTRWLRDEVGGLAAMAEINRDKASLLYDEIDSSDGFYGGHADASSRSWMNDTFRLPRRRWRRSSWPGPRTRGWSSSPAGAWEGSAPRSTRTVPLEAVRALRSFMERFRTATP
jgi:phosphoserine aminotransferase